MGADAVVVLPPLFDQDLGLLQRIEDLPVQEFISQLSVEGFHVTILPGTPGLDIERLDAKPREPLANRIRSEFGTVVGTDLRRRPPAYEELRQALEHVLRSQAALDRVAPAMTAARAHEAPRPEHAP